MIDELYIGDVIINIDDRATGSISLSEFSKKDVYKYIDSTYYHKDFDYTEEIRKRPGELFKYNDGLEIIFAPTGSFPYYIFKNLKLYKYYISSVGFLNYLFHNNVFKLDMKTRRINNIDKILDI